MSGWRAGTDFMADKFMKTVKIKARFNGVNFETPTGQPLPALTPGAMVEISVAATSLVDKEQARRARLAAA